MKKKLLLFLLIFGLLFVTACGDSSVDTSSNKEKTEKKEDSPKNMSKKKIASKLFDINNDLTDLWNEVICEVSHYSYDGTSATGEELDIEFVVKTSKKYYEKVKKNKEFVDELGEDYEDIVEAYDKAFEHATNIYNMIQEETPAPNTYDKYKKDIELFQQYQDYFYEHYDDNEED